MLITYRLPTPRYRFELLQVKYSFQIEYPENLNKIDQNYRKIAGQMQLNRLDYWLMTIMDVLWIVMVLTLTNGIAIGKSCEAVTLTAWPG